ncbi:hypothetical protein SAMN05660706_1015 [Desulfoscipio geothermicus DSM 3669]|uniref:Uncharacterized protein n=1 Tax=Desulfoscipio geothermicus DSM 3669 TaxID=1121426 RepID=A0A1I6CN34_9FIRM|nr:hypothetical protein SAMN05660706_1015 [Desulfoscipio geothermicus DSM 3669]
MTNIYPINNMLKGFCQLPFIEVVRKVSARHTFDRCQVLKVEKSSIFIFQHLAPKLTTPTWQTLLKCCTSMYMLLFEHTLSKKGDRHFFQVKGDWLRKRGTGTFFKKRKKSQSPFTEPQSPFWPFILNRRL